MDLYSPPPHLEHEWAALSADEKADVYRWAREHAAGELRRHGKRMTHSPSGTELARMATFQAADYLDH